MKRFAPLLSGLLLTLQVYGQADTLIRVGAKHFNEGYILSEMISILLEEAGYTVERKFSLGGTAVAFEALRNDAIDIYPEYTGTIAYEILKQEGSPGESGIRDALLRQYGLEISRPYGFNNSYALVMKRENAAGNEVHDISGLAVYPDMRIGLSYEFMKRADGWEKLSRFYNLPQSAFGMEHGLAYQGLLDGTIDITDAYTTDGEIEKYDLKLLADDRNFFPEYKAVSFYRSSLPMRARAAVAVMTSLISEKEMQTLNAMALFDGKKHIDIARNFLIRKGAIAPTVRTTSGTAREIVTATIEHLKLTLIALIAAVLVAFPSGILVYRNRILSGAMLYLTGILQTIPSIALLALMIPIFGIGMLPALVALFLYALLPVLRNTVIGFVTIDPELRRVASAIGLNEWNSLILVEIPLAFPAVITGIRTAAVISVGTATLAAFIGAGGLGQFIVTGLALNNTTLILQGAIPAALLAILIELVFEGIERRFIPRHLRQKF